MYGLPQVGILTNKQLKVHLIKYGLYTIPCTIISNRIVFIYGVLKNSSLFTLYKAINTGHLVTKNVQLVLHLCVIFDMSMIWVHLSLMFYLIWCHHMCHLCSRYHLL